MASGLRYFIIVLIFEISAGVIQNLENIRSVSVFVPDPCYKKANWGNNVIFNYILFNLSRHNNKTQRLIRFV